MYFNKALAFGDESCYDACMKNFVNFYRTEEGEICSVVSVKFRVTLDDLITSIQLMLWMKRRITKKSVFEFVVSERREDGNNLPAPCGRSEKYREEARALARHLFPRFFEDHWA